MSVRLTLAALLITVTSNAWAQTAEKDAHASYETARVSAHSPELMSQHGGMMNWLLLIDRLEWREGETGSTWQGESQAWWGGDERKVWVKADAAVDGGHALAEDVQLLLSQAVAPYWDLQAGLRRTEDFDANARGWLVLGLQGLAPAWFNVDAALYASDEGQWESELELEYTLRLTQRLLLQPRFDARMALTGDGGQETDAGLLEATLGLRLRYEIRREFAPYLGLEWTPAGHAAPHEAAAVVGLRIWY